MSSKLPEGPSIDPGPQTPQVRLMSALVLLLGLGLFFALPFVLSIGSVVFLPLVAALILTIMMSPLADRLMAFGLPNSLASIGSLLVFLCVLIAALALIIQPAISLFDTLPAIVEQVGDRFDTLRDDFAWIAAINAQIGKAIGDSNASQVVIAAPTMLEEIAFATPSVLIEALIMFLMAYFMIEARVRMRRRLLFDRASIGASVKAARAIRAVQDKVAAYILTVSMINAGLGVIVALGAWALGLEAPIMWGGLAMLLNFVPYIGPMAMTALLALFGLGTAETIWVGLSYAAAYLLLNAIEANIITPSVLGKRFAMSPVMILIALSYFTWIWGVVGALLSVPILLTLTSLFDHIGRPNIVGFVFGEPLFHAGALEEFAAEEHAETASS